jgi:hypothetical protein
MSKHELTLYYSVNNGGDGSAYPEFMESAELCEFAQDNMNEGWGESCTGSITLESDSPITVKDVEITTKENYLYDSLLHDVVGCGIEDEEEEYEKITKFMDQFFPNGIGEITVECDDEPYYDNYYKHHVSFNGKYAGYTTEEKGSEEKVKNEIIEFFKRMNEFDGE